MQIYYDDCYRAFSVKVWTDCIHKHTGGEYLRIRTQAATREYASNVPMDMRSTRSFRSNRKAIIAADTRVHSVLKKILLHQSFCKTTIKLIHLMSES